MAQVSAKLNNLRLPPRKVRAVADLLRGKNAVDALNQLEYFVRRPVAPLKKLLSSAIANAENNLNMVKDNLFIKSLTVDEGMKLKRFKAKGFGRASRIQKKTSHITITLDERAPGLRREKQKQFVKNKETKEEPNKKEADVSNIKKPEIKKEIGSKGNFLGGLGKKMFQRKSI